MMTRNQLRNQIADRLQAEFPEKSSPADGGSRPLLDRENCELIASIVLSELDRSQLGLYEKSSEMAFRGRV